MSGAGARGYVADWLAGIVPIVVPVDIAFEVDSAAPVSNQQSVSVTTTNENDLAQAVSSKRVVTVNLVNETDTATVVAPKQVVTVGICNEIDTALQVIVFDIINEGIALETDSTANVKPVHVDAVSQINEVDTTQIVRPQHTVLVSQAGETDSASTPRPGHLVSVGLTNETDTALSVAPATPNTINVIGVNEVDSATDITISPGTFSWANYGGHGLHTNRPRPKPEVVTTDQARESDSALECSPRIVERVLYVSDVVPVKSKPRLKPKPAKIIQAVSVGIVENDELFQEQIIQLELLGVI